jgi:hypothetical protein
MDTGPSRSPRIVGTVDSDALEQVRMVSIYTGRSVDSSMRVTTGCVERWL